MAQHEQSRKKTHGLRKWLIFIVLAVGLFALLWLGWSITHHRRFIRSLTELTGDTSLTVGIHNTAPKSLDMRLAGDINDSIADRASGNAALRQALLGNVYETLVALDDHNKPVPSLAKSWKISNDAMTYTFKLNNEMRFSNGDALDSSDVIYSFTQSLNGSNPSAEADGLSNFKTVTAPDPSTIVITLNTPNPRLLTALATSSGIIYDQTGHIDFATQALGSGPLAVREFVPGKSITLVRNSLYWGDQSASQQITLRYFADTGSMQKELDNGHIQLAALLPSDSPAPFQADHKAKVSSGAGITKVVLALNNGTNSIFSDERARKAVRYTVDNGALARSRGEADTVLGGPVGPLESGYEDLTSLFPPDLAQGQNSINYFGPSYIGNVKFIVPASLADLGTAVAQQLSQTRLATSPQVLDDETFSETLNNGDYTLALTEMSQSGSAGSYADSLYGYQNSDAQQLYHTAIQASNDGDYQNGIRAFARVVSQDCASDWLYTEHSTVAATSGVHGYPQNMTDQRLLLNNLARK